MNSIQEISDKYIWPVNFPEKQVISLFDILMPDFLFIPISKASSNTITTKKLLQNYEQQLKILMLRSDQNNKLII